MKKIIISKKGGPEALQLKECDMPTLSHDEVLIRVSAAGVAFADIMLREGLYPGYKAKGSTPGYDVLGVVESVGSQCEELSRGDLVLALTEVGGYSEYVAVPQQRVVKCPQHAFKPQAVSLVLNYLTAYQMLTHIARIRPGDSVLIHGAAGGVGTALIEICNIIGDIEIWGTASSSKHAMLSALNVLPIDYHNEDVNAKIRAIRPQGVDFVLDPIGGLNWKQSFDLLSVRGMLIAYGFSSITQQGRLHIPSLLKFLMNFPYPGLLTSLKQTKAVAGYNIRAYLAAYPESFRQDMSILIQWFAEGKLNPLVGRFLPLSEAAAAHKALGEKQVEGKIVLEI